MEALLLLLLFFYQLTSGLAACLADIVALQVVQVGVALVVFLFSTVESLWVQRATDLMLVSCWLDY